VVAAAAVAAAAGFTAAAAEPARIAVVEDVQQPVARQFGLLMSEECAAAIRMWQFAAATLSSLAAAMAATVVATGTAAALSRLA
jgi:hypothetical protein